MRSIQNEENVIKVFNAVPIFTYNDKEYRLLVCGKPRSQTGSGEPKTDIYTKFIVDGVDIEEIKISLKQTDYEFLENKIRFERFEALVGKGNGEKKVREIVETIFKQDLHGFEKSSIPQDDVIRHPGEAPCTKYLLGYRLDITNKKCANRSCPLNLTLNEKKEIFTGATLDEGKRNAVVNGMVIKDSGVANMFLEMNVSGEETPQEILDRCRSFDDDSLYEDFEPVGTLKAVNYFSNGKYEHRRLAVCVEYSYDGTQVVPKFVIERPLVIKTSEVVGKLLKVLAEHSE